MWHFNRCVFGHFFPTFSAPKSTAKRQHTEECCQRACIFSLTPGKASLFPSSFFVCVAFGSMAVGGQPGAASHQNLRQMNYVVSYSEPHTHTQGHHAMMPKGHDTGPLPTSGVLRKGVAITLVLCQFYSPFKTLTPATPRGGSHFDCFLSPFFRFPALRRTLRGPAGSTPRRPYRKTTRQWQKKRVNAAICYPASGAQSPHNGTCWTTWEGEGEGRNISTTKPLGASHQFYEVLVT